MIRMIIKIIKQKKKGKEDKSLIFLTSDTYLYIIFKNIIWFH